MEIWIKLTEVLGSEVKHITKVSQILFNFFTNIYHNNFITNSSSLTYLLEFFALIFYTQTFTLILYCMY